MLRKHVLKRMDYKRQTAVLSSIFVVVGMIFLVPAITQKALAGVDATMTGVCGPEGQTHPCQLNLEVAKLSSGTWVSKPTESGTVVNWKTTGNLGDEKGTVTYFVGDVLNKVRVRAEFDNPLIGG